MLLVSILRALNLVTFTHCRTPWDLMGRKSLRESKMPDRLFSMPSVIRGLPMALLVAVVSFIATFAMALGPIPWILSSESFPNRVRGRAMFLATFVIWTSCYIVAQTFPMLNDNPRIGPALTFWIFAICSLLGFFFVLAMVPETKGRSLEEIETSWTKN